LILCDVKFFQKYANTTTHKDNFCTLLCSHIFVFLIRSFYFLKYARAHARPAHPPEKSYRRIRRHDASTAALGFTRRRSDRRINARQRLATRRSITDTVTQRSVKTRATAHTGSSAATRTVSAVPSVFHPHTAPPKHSPAYTLPDSEMADPVASGTICAGGSQSACPHDAGSGVLYAGTPIVMDVFPRSMTSGYWGDLTRTMVKGRAPEVVKRAYHAVLEAREHAKTLIRPGAVPEEIHNAAAAMLEKRGFLTGRNDVGDFGFFHGLGHGVGLEIHEAPRLSLRNRTPLKGGEIVTVEPGLYYPEWGGIRLEDMVYVEPSGACRCLTQVEDFLEIP